MDIIDSIKSEASRQKLSVAEIARRMDMSSQSLNQMLRAESIKFSVVQKIACVLNVSVSSLLNENIDNVDEEKTLKENRLISIIESQQLTIQTLSETLSKK